LTLLVAHKRCHDRYLARHSALAPFSFTPLTPSP